MMRKAKWVKIGDEWHLMVTMATVKLQGRYALYEIFPDRVYSRVIGRDYSEVAIRRCEEEVIKGYSNLRDRYVTIETIGDKPANDGY